MNNTAKHTPGPLHNVTGHRPGPWIRQVLNDESEAYIHDKHCNAIARVYSLSDAALIAAAPAMYALIKDMRQAFYVDGKRKALLAVMERSHDVVAQAEGRQPQP